MPNEQTEGRAPATTSSTDNNAKEAEKALRQEALTLYECRGGMLVTNPKQCREFSKNTLPGLEIV